MRNPIIPENIKKRKFVLINRLNLTFFDLLTIVICCIPAIIVIAVFYSKTKVSIIALIPCLVLGILLCRQHPSGEGKVYEIIIRRFNHKLKKKQYVLNNGDSKGGYVTQNLVPYEAAQENLIKLKSDFYLTLIRIDGNNFFDLEDSKKDFVLEGMYQVYSRFTMGAMILKLNEFKNAKDKILNLEEMEHDLEKKSKNHVINDKQYFSRKYVIANMKNSLIENEGKVENVKQSIYLAFYHESPDELIDLEYETISNLKTLHLNPIALNIYEKINVLNKLFEIDLEDDADKNIEESLDNLENYFAYYKLENQENLLKIDNNRYMKITGISKYPYSPNMTWLRDIFALPNNIVVRLRREFQNNYETALSKAQKLAEMEVDNTSKKYVLTKKRKEEEVKKLDEFAETIGRGLDTLWSFNVFIIHNAIINPENGKSKYRYALRDLKTSVKNSEKLLKEMNMKSINYLCHQLDCFSSMLPKPFDPMIKEGFSIPLYTIAYGHPYLDNVLNDESGFYIGKSKVLGDQLFFNSHLRNEQRKNSNMFFVATSGAGKSTAMQKMLINEIIADNKIYIVDPEGEYKNIARFFGENYINVGSNFYKINPLQIFASADDFEMNDEMEFKTHEKAFWGIETTDIAVEDKNENQNIKMILEHESVIEVLFKTFYRDISDDEIRFIKLNFLDFYKNWMVRVFQKDATKQHIITWENTDFPILNDWYQYLLNVKPGNEKDKQHLSKWIAIFHDGFITNKQDNYYGTYAMYYNGHTTLNINNNSLNVFDVSTLFQGANTQLRIMQMFLIIKLIEQKIKVINKTEPTRKQRVIVDEAHLLIDPDRPIELDFLYKLVKMIRKRNGGITIITQNPEDFVSTPNIEKKTKAIINNSQYAVLMGANAASIAKIEQMFADSDGFTNNEKVALENATAGQGLLVVGKNNNRYQLVFDISSTDWEVIRNEDENIKDYTLNAMTTRIYNRLNQMKYVALDDNHDLNQIIKISNHAEVAKNIVAIKMKEIFDLSIFESNFEIKDIHFNDRNWLVITFKDNYEKLAQLLYDKYAQKILTLKNKQNYVNNRGEYEK